MPHRITNRHDQPPCSSWPLRVHQASLTGLPSVLAPSRLKKSLEVPPRLPAVWLPVALSVLLPLWGTTQAQKRATAL
jgi:hypothetical protein